MSKTNIFMNLSVGQRLWILAGTALFGSAAIAGVSVYGGMQMRSSLALANHQREQIEIINAMRFETKNAILAAMDTIVDRDEGKVQPERLEIVARAFAMLDANRDVLAEIGTLVGKPELSATFTADVADARKAIEVDLRTMVETGAPEEAYDKIDDAIDGAGERLATALGEAAELGGDAVADELAGMAAANLTSIQIQAGVGLAAVLGVLFLQMHLGASIRRGIRSVGESMSRIAGGDVRTAVPDTNRSDELGEMARATEVFRLAALDKIEMERAAEAERAQNETDRQGREAVRKADSDAIHHVVESLAHGLNRLAEGDVTVTLDTPFRADLERLRIDFNQTTERLNTALAAVRHNAMSIQANSNQMRASADDLSRRTEQQAAALEETSAALDQITATVRSAAVRAEEAGHMVEDTKKNTEHSGTVVRDAMAAMGRIEDASREIGKIINVIDEIAFQTNLLALNAGVEAARAGEAGKGFAVVAQEVRELASRAAGAAKDIKSLITKSGSEVKTGVELVTATGEALQQIGADVLRINDHVKSIVTSAREQTTGLTEINHAVEQMDQVTQKNAAMVEESNAVSHSLAADANGLAELIGQFRTRDVPAAAPRASAPRSPAAAPPRPSAQPARPAAAAASARPAASPAKALLNRVSGAFGRTATAEKPVQSAVTDQWEEF